RRVQEIIEQGLNIEDFVVLMCHIYRTTSGKLVFNSDLEYILKDKTGREVLKKHFFRLKNDHGFALSGFHDLILSNELYDDGWFELLSHVFCFKKDSTEYYLSEEKLTTKLEALLTQAINCGENDIFDFVQELSKNDRCKDALVEIIDEFDAEKIITLPVNLYSLAFDLICTGDNIFEYDDHQQVLLALAKKGNKKHFTSLKKVIIGKLQVDNSLNDVIEILDNVSDFNLFTKRDLAAIVQELENKLISSDNSDKVAALLKKIDPSNKKLIEYLKDKESENLSEEKLPEEEK
ncbi:hypothetical protein ACFL49_03245, partial [Candidatus Omnitrophota bacterium]